MAQSVAARAVLDVWILPLLHSWQQIAVPQGSVLRPDLFLTLQIIPLCNNINKHFAMQMIPTFIYSLCLTRHLFEIALPWLPATLRNLGVIFSRPSVCTLNTWEGWTSFTLLKIVILKSLFMCLLLLGWTIFHFHLVTFKAPWKAISISQSTNWDRMTD